MGGFYKTGKNSLFIFLAGSALFPLRETAPLLLV